MPRLTMTLAVFLALSAWAGAQAPVPPLTAADQIRLFRANRTLITDLVQSGIKLGVADHPVDRAAACQETARWLGVALRRAAETSDPDADRVAELGGHLETVVRYGLVPMLDEARQTTPPESQDAARLKLVRETAAGDLDLARSAIPTSGKVGESEKVRDLRGKLDGLRERLKLSD